MTLVIDYMTLVIDYMTVMDYMTLVIDYMTLVIDYMTLVIDYALKNKYTFPKQISSTIIFASDKQQEISLHLSG
jgi:hypothetical protein